MDNQEAIKILGQYDVSNIHFYTTDGEEIPFTEWSDAIEMAISALQAQEETVSRKVYEQISWERDIAVMQLKDLGYGLGEKIRTDGGTISRQAAIDAVYKCSDIFVGDMPVMVVKADAYEALAQLPSAQPEVLACGEGELIAQPEIIRCNDCKHWTQTTGNMRGFGLGDCDYINAKLVNCNGFCYWAERRTDEV